MRPKLSVAWGACGLLLASFASGGEWQPLYNGQDLSGWKVIEGDPAAWKAEGDLLVCTGGGGGWLGTTKEYRDFEIELEYRVPPGGNSGVFLRAPLEGNPAFAGLEIQVLDDYAPEYANLKPSQYTGSVYSVAAAEPRVTKKAGEWQKMRIVCQGPKVKVELNGTQVVDANLDEHRDKLPEHPGIGRTKGFLGLQNHGSRLEYRNLRVREL